MPPIPIATSPLSAAQTSVVLVTCNSDIMQLTARLNRCIFEMQHAQSSGITMTIDADKRRIGKYLSDLRVQVNNVYSMGVPDNPKTQPEQIVLPDVEEKAVENDDFKAVIDQLYILRDEMIGSQSSRLGGGLIPPDFARAIAMLDRIDTLFNLFIPAVEPQDNPESTPSVPMTGHGRQGN